MGTHWHDRKLKQSIQKQKIEVSNHEPNELNIPMEFGNSNIRFNGICAFDIPKQAG